MTAPTPNPEDSGKLRDHEAVVKLSGALEQIQLWAAIQADNAPPLPGHIDGELLSACRALVSELGDIPVNSVDPIRLHITGFAIATAHIREVQFRVTSASILEIHQEACALRDAVGHDILQKHFQGYDDLFKLLGDAVGKIERNRDELLAWAAEHHDPLVDLYKRMRACQTAAVAGKSSEKRKFLLAIGGTVIAAIGVIAAILQKWPFP